MKLNLLLCSFMFFALTESICGADLGRKEQDKKQREDKRLGYEQHEQAHKKQEQTEQVAKEQATTFSDIQKAQIAQRQKISDDSIRIFYKGQLRSLPLYIPRKQLTNPADLRRLLEKSVAQGVLKFATQMPGFIDSDGDSDDEDWDDKEWHNIFQSLSKASEMRLPNKIDFNNLSQFVHDTRSILKSFLPASDQVIILTNQHFLKKNSLGRLITYAELERVINKEHLSHVRLPLKFLIIKDRRTGEYLTGQTAEKLLNAALSIDLYLSKKGRIIPVVNYDMKNYEVYILAQEQHDYKLRIPLQRAALEDLVQLIKQAPFDVGNDNIFSDAQGNAVIIDTEFKGESSANCLPKLERYNRTGTPLDVA